MTPAFIACSVESGMGEPGTVLHVKARGVGTWERGQALSAILLCENKCWMSVDFKIIQFSANS